MSASQSIRERMVVALERADRDLWFTQREIAELINAKYGSVRNDVRHLHMRDGLLERRVVQRDVRNPRTGDSSVHGYRWKR